MKKRNTTTNTDESQPVLIEEDDDAPRGILLSRKQALVMLGGVTFALFGGSRPARAADVAVSRVCVALPEMTAGPFYLDKTLERSDIRMDPSDGSVRPGIPLDLVVNVSRLAENSCVPLEGAIVDIWHCDAFGVYSGVQDRNGDGSGTAFLRGYQRTDRQGLAHFTTIYPGWYRGRAVHIHFKIRSAADETNTYEFTSQLFFDDALTDTVHGTEFYVASGPRDRRNTDDGIFRGGGEQLTLDLVKTDEGYAAAFDIAIDTNRPTNH